MRIDNPHHPLHYIRQSVRELYRRTRNAPAGTKFRLTMSDGTPVIGSILQWNSVPGIGTTLKYRVLKTNEIREFSWMEPGDVVHVDPVDTSKDGYDFYGLRFLSALRKASAEARKQKLLREESDRSTKNLALALSKSQAVIKVLAAELKKELGNRKLAAIMRTASKPSRPRRSR